MPDAHASTVSTTLDDGTRILLRPITPADRGLLEDGLAKLSEHSRYLRFFGAVGHLRPEQLDYLTDVDQTSHVAWGALDSDGTGLGVGRFIRLKEAPDVAEAAVTVVDAFQHRGLGKILFGLLYLRAFDLKLRELRAFLLDQNHSFAELLGDLGSTVEVADGSFVVNVPVHPPEAFPDTLAGREFKSVLRRLRESLKAHS